MMVDIRDCFLRELDQEPTGISGHIEHYKAILGTLEPKVLEVIEANEVTHQFYLMRWFMLLMCQEFNIRNIMRVWDSILAADAHPVSGKGDQGHSELSPIKYEYVDFISVALVQNLGDKLIEADDFSDIMEMLQAAAQEKHIESVEKLLERTQQVCLDWMKHQMKKMGSKNAPSSIKYKVVIK